MGRHECRARSGPGAGVAEASENDLELLAQLRMKRTMTHALKLAEVFCSIASVTSCLTAAESAPTNAPAQPPGAPANVAIRAGEASAPSTNEPAVILTPKPSPKPRINGAKVFGVRPGNPFMFTIPATGDRPMTFAADGLPAGLRLDPQTGFITGKIADKGEYNVTLHAKNSLGEATRGFKDRKSVV
jgi:hypothetical protein